MVFGFIVFVAVIIIVITVYLHLKPIKAGISTSKCTGMNVDEVEEVFENAGFSYVFDEGLNDLDLKDVSKENTVERVVIGGTKDFLDTDEFSRDDRVYVYYHSLKVTQMPITSDDAKGKYYKDVENMFRKAGFDNITFTVKDDLVRGFLKKDGDVESVYVDGNCDYYDWVNYRLDAKIEIVYHTFPKN